MRTLIKRITPKKLILAYRKLREAAVKLLFALFRIFPIDRQLVVFANVWGYGDNSKYVCEALAEMKASGHHKEAAHLRIVFVTDTSKPHPDTTGVEFLRTNSVKAIKALATAAVWVDCNRKEPYIVKRAGQKYIQLWHGGLALKKIEGDCAEFLTEEYLANAKRDTQMTDLYVSNGRFCTEMFRRAFGFEGEILEAGSPRDDILVHPDEGRIEDTRKRLGLKKGEKLVLYAPTYRDNEATSTGKTDNSASEDANLDNAADANLELLDTIDFASIEEVLEERFNSPVRLMVRLHPLVREAMTGKTFTSKNGRKVLDGNAEADIFRLLEAADMLITDYSSTMFEFALTGRPLYLYTPDEKAYEEGRGTYFTLEELPFPKASDAKMLYEMLKNDRTNADYRGFLEKTGTVEPGDAAEKVAKRILQW